MAINIKSISNNSNAFSWNILQIERNIDKINFELKDFGLKIEKNSELNQVKKVLRVKMFGILKANANTLDTKDKEKLQKLSNLCGFSLNAFENYAQKQGLELKFKTLAKPKVKAVKEVKKEVVKA